MTCGICLGYNLWFCCGGIHITSNKTTNCHIEDIYNEEICRYMWHSRMRCARDVRRA